MRQQYPPCILIGDVTRQFVNICRSLRFSTHCTFLIASERAPFDTSGHVHMSWCCLDSLTDATFPADEPVLVIFCLGGEVVIEHFDDPVNLGGYLSECVWDLKNRQPLQTASRKNPAVPVDQSGSLGAIVARCISTHLAGSGEAWRADVVLMLDYEGVPRFLGGMWAGIDGSRTSLNLFSPELHSDIQSAEFGALRFVGSENSIFSLSITDDGSGGKPDVSLLACHNSDSWTMLRAVGINIPLIIVQNFLRRKVVTHYFVSPRDVTWCRQDDFPRYGFDFDHAYFDLDETLTWLGGPLVDGISALRKLYSAGVSLTLITRHTKPIADTLASIGVDPTYFRKIIPVKKTQLKSSYIGKRSIFIDNEFAERHDVRKNCEIPVLDVDQLDFLPQLSASV
ncbi:hypothetical protein [uncultured Roseobacter sp.]|uniref:hypothetical protein n=1 Tax=uncultured Roseobacter sp. TaxID=114847 RepID=UPI0026087BE2|nr:hypothetical protein [uncultured Roseobacter sp.]